MTTRHYLGIAEQLPENWSISFPAFPGTVTTGGDFAELLTNARDALASVVAAMEEDGERIPDSFDASPEAPSYNPADYTEEEWRSWMTKMSKKAKLNPDQAQLLSRYLDVFRSPAKQEH